MNKKTITLTCPICQKVFEKDAYEYKRHKRKREDYVFFCSRACSTKYANKASTEYHAKNAEEYIKAWLAGKKPGHYVGSNNNKLREYVRTYLFEEADYKCSRCGFSGENEVTGNTILQIHHKDGNSENSSKENLEVLCPNCHAMTDTFMNLNAGSGRKARY